MVYAVVDRTLRGCGSPDRGQEDVIMASRRIGVVGGVGPAATILYYRLLIEGARARPGGFPKS